MSTKKSSAKKGAKARGSKAKKGPKKSAPERTESLAKTTGEKLTALLKGVKGANGAAKLAANLAKGELKHSDLVALRDGINEVTTKLREDEKSDEARELSGLNRYVRRLERASR